jgi:hypothetical protein
MLSSNVGRAYIFAINRRFFRMKCGFVTLGLVLLCGVGAQGVELWDGEVSIFEPYPGERRAAIFSVTCDQEMEYWGEPETFGEFGADEVRPKSAVGPEGEVYLVYMSNGPYGLIWEVSLQPPSGDIVKVSLIDGEHSGHPNIAVDGAGNAYIAYYDKTPGHTEVECAIVYPDGDITRFDISDVDGRPSGRWVGYEWTGSFGQPKKYFRNDLAVQGPPICLCMEQPAVAVGPSGVHFVYTELSDDGYWYLMYKMFCGTEETACDTVCAGEWDAICPVVGINSDYVHIGWQDHRNNRPGLYYQSRWEGDGHIISRESLIDGGDHSCITPHLWVDEKEHVFFVWGVPTRETTEIWACVIRGFPPSRYDGPVRISNRRWSSEDPFGEDAGIDYCACWYPQITGSGSYPSGWLLVSWEGKEPGVDWDVWAAMMHQHLRCSGGDMLVSSSELDDKSSTVALVDGYKPAVTWQTMAPNRQWDLARSSWLPEYVKCLGEVGGDPFEHFCFPGPDPQRYGWAMTIPDGEGIVWFEAYDGVEQVSIGPFEIPQ